MNHLDERLFLLKVQSANRRMHTEAGGCWARANAETHKLGNSAHLIPAFIECELKELREYLEEVNRVCRDVWLLDGNPITPEFIRNVLLRHVFETIAARKGAIQEGLNRHARRSGEHGRGGRFLAQQINLLQGEMVSRYEAEAIELGKSISQARWITLGPPTLTGTSGTHENLRNAILKTRARTVEIERTLNRHPTTEIRGQPAHGSQSWRQRLEEERQHLLTAVAELERELELSVVSHAESSEKRVQVAEGKPAMAAAREMREAFLRPILKQKGFSVHDWANRSRVDFHTADNYLKGKTSPYPGTLRKLADALDIEVAKLPL